jgi:hypothetical protein
MSDGNEVANHAILLPYNGTDPKGADPREFDVNLWYEVSGRILPGSPSGNLDT